MDKLFKILQTLKIPIAYNHFAEGQSPRPPFLCYLTTDTDCISADGVVQIKKTNIRLELYTTRKDTKAEGRVENLLDTNEIYYEKQEAYIDSEKLYEVSYLFEYI